MPGVFTRLLVRKATCVFSYLLKEFHTRRAFVRRGFKSKSGMGVIPMQIIVIVLLLGYIAGKLDAILTELKKK